MKKIYLAFVLVSLFCCNLFAQKQALIIGYSQTENVYEDENIKAELFRLDLVVTNKTNKTIYIDKKSSFYYVNEKPICFYKGKETHTKDGVTIIEKDNTPIAPKSTYSLYYDAPLRNTYNVGGGFSRFSKGSSNVLTDDKVALMGYIETLRYELANNQDQSASKLHLTGDDSFLKVSVSLNYTLNPRMEDLTPVTLVTWVSDMVMSKYYVQPKDKFVKTNAVNAVGRMFNILHVFADAPFEYKEDESPLDMYIVDFGKGSFTLSQFNNVKESSPFSRGGSNDEMLSNLSEEARADKNIFVWEGETNNWIQALIDSYEKFLIEDGEKPKDALKKAKDEAKKAKSNQTLHP